MDVLKQSHDKFFRSTFGQVEIASDFLNNYLPKNLTNIIDIKKLEPQKDSFLDENLKEEISDLLFKVNINNKEGYISIRDDISEKEMEKIAEKISIEGGELVMSVAERLRQEGEEKGRQEGLRKAAKKSIIKGYATEEIADITGLTEKEIEEIRDEMLN